MSRKKLIFLIVIVFIGATAFLLWPTCKLRGGDDYGCGLRFTQYWIDWKTQRSVDRLQTFELTAVVATIPNLVVLIPPAGAQLEISNNKFTSDDELSKQLNIVLDRFNVLNIRQRAVRDFAITVSSDVDAKSVISELEKVSGVKARLDPISVPVPLNS
jgi:hypothetical protein